MNMNPRSGGEGGPARDVSGGTSRAAGVPEFHRGGFVPGGPGAPIYCWLCGLAIADPPQIIGQRLGGRLRIAHRHCLHVLGALDLNLPFPPSAT